MKKLISKKSARARKLGKKHVDMRKKLWPDVAEERLMTGSNSNGWTFVPRTLPLVLRTMDELAPSGIPVSAVYFDLWCRVFEAEQSFVKLGGKHEEMAFASGFGGQRGVQTWQKKIKALSDLGFIDLKPSGESDIGYALIFNPHVVVKSIHDEKPEKIPERLWIALLERSSEVGNDELDAAAPDDMEL